MTTLLSERRDTAHASDPYAYHDPIPVPHATEHASDTVWQMWEDLKEQQDMRFADTEPVSMPASLQELPHAPVKPAAFQTPPATSLTVETVMAEARRNARVCPRAEPWLRLYNALPGKDAAHRGKTLSPPLDAYALAVLPSLPKRLCLREHVEWAAAHGCLAEVHDYLRQLPELDWQHLGE